MNTTTATAQTVALHIHTSAVLAGAEALLARMYETPCVNGSGFYPREVIAQERRVAMLRDRLDAIECPEL